MANIKKATENKSEIQETRNQQIYSPCDENITALRKKWRKTMNFLQ